MDEEGELSMDEETLKSVPKIKRERSEAQKANDQKNREFLLAKHQAMRDEKRKKEEEKAEKERLKQQKKKEAEDAKPTNKKPTIKVVKKQKPIEPESDDEDLELPEDPIVPVKQSRVKSTRKPRAKKVAPQPSPVSEYEDEEEEEEEEQYVPPPKAPRRQMTQHIQQPVPQQYYAPVPQRVRPIITYV
jgi:hypothetical protein